MPVRISHARWRELSKQAEAHAAPPPKRPKRPRRPKGGKQKRVDHADTLRALLAVHGRHLPPHHNEYFCFDDSEHRTDLAWLDHGLIVEVDGGRHAHQGGRHASDEDYAKMNRLAALGWLVVRFTPTMLSNDPLGCIAAIEAALNAPRPAQLQAHGGRRPPRPTKARRGPKSGPPLPDRSPA